MSFTVDYDPREEQARHHSSLLNALNPAQTQAVQQMDGPVLVLAGAGTGKTRVLTTRLAALIQSGKAFPGQILAVTFTNKAAQEMKMRVSESLGGQAVEGWWLGTFHALAARMLRSHAPLVGLDSNFTILDSDDQVRLMKQILEDQNIDPKKTPPKMLIDVISSFKDKAKAPEDLTLDDVGDLAGGKGLELYRIYQSRLKTHNACDFGDLLLHMVKILKNPAHANVLEDYHRRFRYIMVDEYQDTNVAQYLWLRLLAQGSGNICCVGDDDQSIYGWRGAEIDNILRFEKDFPGALVVRLEENYRSTAHILNAANAVIAQNQGRLGKELYTNLGEGEKVSVQALWDGAAEARWVGEEIEAAQAKGVRLSAMAVLVRTGFQMREFEERFIQLGLAYRVIGGPRFYERMEIRDALAYLRVMAQKQDSLALERILNTPKRGLGNATIQTFHTHARHQNISLYEAIEQLLETDELRPKVKKTLAALFDDFERWRSQIETSTPDALAAQILEESGYNAMWKADKSPEAPGRLENLKELVSAMNDYETMQEFLEHVALVLDTQDGAQGDSITLMTLHAAKGLEFPVVFLPGWEDGLFPSQRSMDENGTKGLEEERRLAYVGITRAREKAYISYAANRRMYGSWVNSVPSRFVDELPEAHIEVKADTGLYVPGRSQHWDSSGWEKQESRAESPATVEEGYQMGERVFHEKFGYGTIIHIEGQKLDIEFEKAGSKRVMDSFVVKA